jgi:hypothetical protein
MPELSGWHIGRHFGGPGDIEFACPCPKTECGLVEQGNTDPNCPEHPAERAKTIRSGHRADLCQGASHSF